MSGALFVITAPSGAGKTSLIEAIMRDDPTLKESVSYTTRAPRKGEQNGERKRERDAERREQERDDETAPAFVFDIGETEDAAPHQHADRREPACPY
jgi:ribose 1,5-bisphosphokinase PhnN